MRDTHNATSARKRSIAVVKGGYVQGCYGSLKECSSETGVPPSRICEYAKSGRIYKGGIVFKYL